MFMENLSIFYRILSEDLSPLIDLSQTGQYSDFIKKRYPDYTRQLKIKVSLLSTGYRISEFKELNFCDIEPTKRDADNIHSNKDEILDFVCKQLQIKPQTVLENTISTESLGLCVEIVLKEGYENLSVNKAKYFYYRILLNEAHSVITKGLHHKLFKLKNEDQIRLHIKKYQVLISGYMNTVLQDYIPKDQWNSLFQISDEHTVIDIFKRIYQAMETVIVYMEKSFNRYLDTHQPVSYKSRLLLAMEHSEKLSEVFSHLEWARLDQQLYEIITIPFERLGVLEPLAFSYHNHAYHEAYLLSFHEATLKEESLTNKKVFLILWSMNFNGLKFFNYLTQKIHNELKEKNTVETKLELLYYYQKLCRQLPIKTQLRYNTNLLPLKDQMSIWLQEEISFQKRKLKFNSSEKSNSKNQGEKRLVKMSVPQLSLFIRAIFEAGLVEGTRHEMLRFVCEHYRTDQQEHISEGSLKGKYYKVDTSTKRSVGRLLKKMLTHVESAGKNY